MSGFRLSGVYPHNANVFGDHEYATCFVTDRPLPNSQDETSLIGDIAKSITSATTETYNDTSELGQCTAIWGNINSTMNNMGREVINVTGDRHCLLYAVEKCLTLEILDTLMHEALCEGLVTKTKVTLTIMMTLLLLVKI